MMREFGKETPVSLPSTWYRRHRFPPAIFSHAVYLYYRCSVRKSVHQAASR
jgi:hypothetical protein